MSVKVIGTCSDGSFTLNLNPLTSEQLIQELMIFLMKNVTGWSGVLTPDSQPIPFSFDNLVEGILQNEDFSNAVTACLEKHLEDIFSGHNN